MTRDTAERAREWREKYCASRKIKLGQEVALALDESVTALLTQIQAESRERLSAWMTEHSFSTGHGDTFEDLLKELDWQVKELRGTRLEEAKWWRPRTDLRHDDECSVNNSFSDPFCDCDATKRLKEAEARIAALAQALQPEEKEGT